MYKIYNLEFSQKEFKIGRYRFKQVENYEDSKKYFYKQAVFYKKIKFFANRHEVEKSETPGNEGVPVNTFIAEVVDGQEEDNSNIYKTSKQIRDIILLLSLATGRNVCLEEELSHFDHRVREDIRVPEEDVLAFVHQAINEDYTFLNPSIFYYLHGRPPLYMSMSFMFYYISLESLSRRLSTMGDKDDLLKPSCYEPIKSQIVTLISGLGNECENVPGAKETIKKIKLADLNKKPNSRKMLDLFKKYGILDNKTSDDIVLKKLSKWADLRNMYMHTGLGSSKMTAQAETDLLSVLHDVLTILYLNILKAPTISNLNRYLDDINRHFSQENYRGTWYELELSEIE